MLEVDAGSRQVDVDVGDAQSGRRRTRPQTCPPAVSRAHTRRRPRVPEPDTRLGPSPRRTRLAALDPRDVEIAEAERLRQLRPAAVVRVDEDAVVGEVADDEPRRPESLRLPDDESGADRPVAAEDDVEHPSGVAADRDRYAVHGLAVVADVDDHALEQAGAATDVSHADSGRQDRPADGLGVDRMAVGVEERARRRRRGRAGGRSLPVCGATGPLGAAPRCGRARQGAESSTSSAASGAARPTRSARQASDADPRWPSRPRSRGRRSRGAPVARLAASTSSPIWRSGLTADPPLPWPQAGECQGRSARSCTPIVSRQIARSTRTLPWRRYQRSYESFRAMPSQSEA